MKTIADQIRALRKSKGLSQEALAENAGINLRTLQRIETGNVVPRGETLRLLAQALDVSVEELSAITFLLTFSNFAGPFFVNPLVLVGGIMLLASAVTIYIFTNNKKVSERNEGLYTTSLKIIQ